MSNLKSTIKLESTGNFPSDVSITANGSNVIDGSVNFGKTQVVNGLVFETSNLLTPQTIGRKGATIYAESPSSNGRAIAFYTIQALDAYFIAQDIADQYTQSIVPTPFARLKPGDSMFQHLPYEAVGIIAVTEGGLDTVFGFGGIPEGNTETAVLNYFIGDNGVSNGATAAYLQRDYNNNLGYESYQVRLMDVNTGKQTGFVDLELDNDGGLGWYFDEWIITQNKGYTMIFRNDDTNNYTVVNMNSYGSVTRVVDDIDNNGFDSWDLGGRGTFFTWQDGGNREFRLFDGENNWSYSIVSDGYSLESEWDYSTSTGAIVVTLNGVDGTTGYVVTYLMSKGNLIKLWENRPNLTGLISSNTANNAVFGVGTKFTTEVSVGDDIYWDGDVLLGVVGVINNDTSLELVANATSTVANEVGKVQRNNLSHTYYSYEFGKTIVHRIYDETNNKYKSLTVWNDRGIKLKELNLLPMNLNYFSFDFYGTDRFYVVARANAVGGDTNWRLFAYDATTNILHGKDGDWTTNYVDYPLWNNFTFNKFVGNTDDFETSIDPETMVIAFYDDIYTNQYAFLNQNSSHLTWQILFPGESTHNTYDLTVGPGNVWWRNGEGWYYTSTAPTAKYVHFATSSIDDTTGNLIANTIVSGANTIVQTPIADLSTIANRSNYSYGNQFYGIGDLNASTTSKILTGISTTWLVTVAPGYVLYNNQTGGIIGTVASVDSDTQITLVENSTQDVSNTVSVTQTPSALHYVAFGDYGFYTYYKPTTNTTVFVVLDKTGKIADTLEVPEAKTFQDVWEIQYNTLSIILNNDIADRNWYFNAASKKFVEIPEYYGFRNTPYFAYSNGVNPGVIALNDDSGNNWRILSPNALSPNISIPGKYDPFNIDYWMGETYLFIEFEDDNDPDTYYMLVYDLNGNLVNTVQTLFHDENGTVAYGDRMAKYYDDSDFGGPDAYALITPTSVEYAYDVADNFWTAQNDWEWQQDYWC